jgi:hypothetical protein
MGGRSMKLDQVYFENAKQALVPPNPKLFEIDTLTTFSCGDIGT